MGDKLREIIDDESMDHMGFEEKIKLMLDAETIARSDRKVERLIRQARFEYKDASIEGIQYPPERKLSRDRVDRLTACRWVRDRETLIIISGTGSDKSYISQALGNAAFRNGIPNRYVRPRRTCSNRSTAPGSKAKASATVRSTSSKAWNCSSSTTS